MSVIVVTTVRCDAEDCISEIRQTKDSLMIRCIAEERHGWQALEDGRDFCPAHHFDGNGSGNQSPVSTDAGRKT